MASHLKRLDWKLVVIVLLACYVVPGAVIGGLLVLVKDSLSAEAWQIVTYLLALIGFLVPPVTAGYLAARFARTAVRFHVFIIGTLGAIVSLLAFRTSPRAMVAFAIASLLLAAFGGYIRLSSVGR